jgi:L-aminopeptidase/D-esterase-like protein
MVNYQGSITDVPGIKVGHAQNTDALTGCTVVLCEDGAIGGVDQRGGAPGTRETDLLRPLHLVQKVHAIMLSGGSAFGLDAAGGVMRYLEEQKIGFRTSGGIVPIVPAAVIFDLDIGKAKPRPDGEMGYNACQNAMTTMPAQGTVGAGTGATVGKIFGIKKATKSGVGTASMRTNNGVIVSALIVVNAFGDVIDPVERKIVAGVRGQVKDGTESGSPYMDTLAILQSRLGQSILGFAKASSTVIGVVATNAKLSKEEANKVAQMGHNGLAITIQPAHTMFDGDTLFCLATGKKRSDVNIIGALATQVVARAIINAILYATPAGGLPASIYASRT